MTPAAFRPSPAEGVRGRKLRIWFQTDSTKEGVSTTRSPGRAALMLEDGRRQIVGLSLPGDVIIALGSVDIDMLVWT